MLRVLGSVWSAQLMGLHQLAACTSEAASLVAVCWASTKRGKRSDFKVRALAASPTQAMHSCMVCLIGNLPSTDGSRFRLLQHVHVLLAMSPAHRLH
jgi:hypothetical protein